MFRCRDRDRRAAGFSLVEVICAMAIAAMALVVLLRGLGGSQLAAGYLETHLGARIIAQSILDDEQQATAAATGVREGDSGLYHWRLSVQPIEAPAAVGHLPQAFRLYRLSVDVTWTPRGQFTLETLKLGQ